MKKTRLIFTFIIGMIFLSYCGQHKFIEVSAYSSYNNSDLSAILSLSDQKTSYDSTIQYALGLVGLLDSDIEIETTDDFGAFSVINKLSQRRFFVYSPAYFDSVYSVTKTNFAILSICFHELAHQFYQHPLKPSYASHIYEKQADRYSGFQMCIIGATLEQSQIAMKYFGNDSTTITHPDKSSRLVEIKKGFIDAKIKIFKDSSYLKEDSIFISNELEVALFGTDLVSEMEQLDDSKNVTFRYIKSVVKKYKTKQIYILCGELIYLTNDMKIKLISNGKTIGNVQQINNRSSSKTLNIEGVKFHLENDTDIFSLNPDGSKLEVGNKITTKIN